jgi:hypothetical protein
MKLQTLKNCGKELPQNKINAHLLAVFLIVSNNGFYGKSINLILCC